MKLSGFIEEQWAQAGNTTLRLLLKPAFHPEVCMTVSVTKGRVVLTVHALAEQFWSRGGKVVMNSHCESVEVHQSVREELMQLFQSAHDGFNPNTGAVSCDGMRAESCLVSRECSQRLSAHVYEQRGARDFAARMIDVAWSTCRDPRIKNALARAASYLRGGTHCRTFRPLSRRLV
jgi:hypothetical protein